MTLIRMHAHTHTYHIHGEIISIYDLMQMWSMVDLSL